MTLRNVTRVLRRAVQREATFGRYRLRGRMAAGGMAEVWAAELVGAMGFVKPMVLKRILPERAGDPAYHRMLAREARVVARLSHANICAVFELGEVDGERFIAMEYLRGASLTQLVKAGGALPPATAVALIAQACDGLHHAHEHRDAEMTGLVHRDVSPHNLMVTVDGVVKVLDFGVAKVQGWSSDRTASGEVKGKVGYMAPEQIACEPLDRRADVWALAVVLWELLAGRRLFGGGGPSAVIDRVRAAQVPRLGTSGALARLDDVIAAALRVDRAARTPTAATLRAAALAALGPDAPSERDALAALVWARCADHVAAADQCFATTAAPAVAPPRARRRTLPLRPRDDDGPVAGDGHADARAAAAPPRPPLRTPTAMTAVMGTRFERAPTIPRGAAAVRLRRTSAPPIARLDLDEVLARLTPYPVEVAAVEAAVEAPGEAPREAPVLPGDAPLPPPPGPLAEGSGALIPDGAGRSARSRWGRWALWLAGGVGVAAYVILTGAAGRW